MDEIQLYAGVNKTNALSFFIRIYGKDIGMSFRHVATVIRYPAKLVSWQYKELDATDVKTSAASTGSTLRPETGTLQASERGRVRISECQSHDPM